MLVQNFMFNTIALPLCKFNRSAETFPGGVKNPLVRCIVAQPLWYDEIPAQQKESKW